MYAPLFAVLTTHPQPQSITARLLDRLFPRAPGTEFKTAFETEYAVISVPMPLRRRRWKAIEKTALQFDDGIILPVGLELPPYVKIALCTPSTQFIAEVCINTVSRLISKSKIPKAERTVGLIDLKANHRPMVLILLKEASSVVVLTDEPEQYEEFSEQVFEHFGAPVLIADRGSSLSGCKIVAAPDKISQELCKRSFTAVVAAFSPPEKPRFPLLCSLELELTEELRGMVPKEINPITFLGALFEKCGAGSPGEIYASNGRINGAVTDIYSFARSFIK